jgi:hypothetical protein
MTDHVSNENTFEAATLDVDLNGTYVPTDGYVGVRLWVNVPGNCNLILYYSDYLNGDNAITESYAVYANHVSVINSLIKKAYVGVQLINVTDPHQTLHNVLLRTKLYDRSLQSNLNYTTDDITANVTMSLDELNVNQNITHTGSSMLCYGNDGTTDRPFRTDNCGNLNIVGSNLHGSTVNIFNQRPLLVGGYEPTYQNILTTLLDTDGRMRIVPGPLAVFTVSADTPAGLDVKPGADAVFTVSVDNLGLDVKPGAAAIFTVSAGTDLSGLAIKPGKDVIFNVKSSIVAGVSVNPVPNTVFTVSAGTDLSGLAVKPGRDVKFTVIEPDVSGVAVKPGNNAVFTVSGEVAVKSGTNVVFNVSSSDAAGLAVRPGTTAVFNVAASDASGIAVKPAASAQFAFNQVNAMLSNTNQGYIATDPNFNFRRIGTGTVNAIYSINIFNFNNFFTYYVKLYALDTPPNANTETTVNPLLNYQISFNPRDMAFPRGIKINKPVYVLVSTSYQNTSSADILDINTGLATQPVQITVSYD